MTGTFGYSRSALLDKIVKVTDGWREGTSGKALQTVEVLGLAVLVGRHDIALHLACNGPYPLTPLRQAVNEIAMIRIGAIDVEAPALRTTTLIGVSDPGMWKHYIEIERQYTKREGAPPRDK